MVEWYKQIKINRQLHAAKASLHNIYISGFSGRRKEYRRTLPCTEELLLCASKVLLILGGGVSDRFDKTCKTDPYAGTYKEKQIGTTSCFYSSIHELTTPDAVPPFPYCFGSFTGFFTTQEYTQPAVPRRGPLNESTDSVCTLCCKKHCAVFLELPLCCLNVYMEQLGGLKTDVGSKNTASVQSLFSLDESNDTILKALQTLSSE